MTARPIAGPAVFCLALGAPVGGAALAETYAPPQAAPYVRAAVGAAFVGAIDEDLAYSPFFAPSGPLPVARSAEFSAGPSYAAAVGFQYPAGTRTELEYRRMNADLDSLVYAGGASPFGGPVEDGAQAQALMSNVYVSPAAGARISPYVGVGVGGAFVRNADGARDADFAYQAKAGVDFAVSRRVSIGVEGAYLRTLKLEFGPEQFDPSGPLGPRAVGGVFKALTVMAGVRATF